jgi:hypothetical protein
MVKEVKGVKGVKEVKIVKRENWVKGIKWGIQKRL